MDRFRPTKLLIFTLILLIMIFLFLISLKSSDPTTPVKRKNRMLTHQSSTSGSEKKLREVLRAASMSTRTVILTIVEKSWARSGSILDLFLQSLEIGENTKHLLNHVVIVCLDVESVEYCETIHHPHCFYLQTNSIVYDAKGSFSSINYPTIDHLRIQLLLQVLHFGYNAVYTDADVMWLRNPFPLFNAQAEITIGCDSYSRLRNGIENYNGKVTSGGFFYMKANVISIEFLVLWNLINVLYPHTKHKSVCQMAHYEDFKRTGIDIRFIDRQYYGGFCESNKDISNIYTMHANCCDDLDKKINDLGIFLDDSKYKQLMGKGITLELLSVAAGKSPMKCFSS